VDRVQLLTGPGYNERKFRFRCIDGMVSFMIIKGTFENGHIRILSGIEQLPEGTEVLITPITHNSEANCDLENLRKFKAEMQRIASLPCQGIDDSFSGANHDQLLYGTE